MKKQVIKSYVNKEPLGELQWFEDELNFEATIPYNLDNSFINYSFINDEKDKLLSEVYNQYEILTNFINKQDVNNYNDLTEIRFNAFVKAHYLDASKQNYYLNKSLNSFKDYNLTLVPKIDYTLKFCYENKLVYLQKIKNAPGLILEDLSSGDEQLHFTESAVFFKDKNGKLKLFR